MSRIAIPRLETPIGRALAASRPRLAAALSIALATAALDVLTFRSDAPFAAHRWIAPIVAIVLLERLSLGDRRSCGLVLAPLPSVRYWIRATLVIGALVAALVAASSVAMWLFGADLSPDPLPLGGAASLLQRFCVEAPLCEELVWRVVLVPPAAALLGPWGAVVASGAAFAGLHVLYGNPAPDNLVAGFFLAFAFLRSGSLAVPIALHALGNLCVLATRVAVGTWLVFY